MYIKKDAAAMSERNRAVFEQFTTSQTCPVCHGARLNEAALNCRIGGRNIADLSDLEATELIAFLQTSPTRSPRQWPPNSPNACSTWSISGWVT